MADLTLPPEGRAEGDPLDDIEAAHGLEDPPTKRIHRDPTAPAPAPARRRKRPKLRTMEQIEEEKELHRDYVDVTLKPGVTVRLAAVNRRIEELAKNLDVALRVIDRLGDTPGAPSLNAIRLRAERIAAELEELDEEREELEEKAEEALVRFEFEAIGRVELRNLMRQHPPDDEAREQWDADMAALGQTVTEPLQFHPDNFPPALMARSAIEPTMTEEQAMGIWAGNKWEPGTAALIYGKAWEVNNIAP